MRLTALLVATFLLTGGCDQRPDPPSKSVAANGHAAIDPDYIPTRVPPPDFDPQSNRIYTAPELAVHPADGYKGFPPRIVSLMQRHDIEHGWCKGFGDDPQTYRACNRRDVLYYQLEKQGYCWGSAGAVASAADEYWLRCDQKADFSPNEPISEPHPFTEQEIAEVERESAARGGLKPERAYVRVMIKAPQFDAKGNRVFTQHELARQPAELYAALPDRLRTPMREADMERRLCISGTGPDPQAMRACNRRNIIEKMIERSGLCSHYDARSNQWRWRRCSTDPGYDPRIAFGPPSLFSEREIAEAGTQALEMAARWEAMHRKR